MCTSSQSSHYERRCATGPGGKSKDKTTTTTKWEWQCSYKIKLHVNNQNNWVKKRVCVNSPRHTPPDRPCPPPEWQSLRSESGVETDDLSSTSCWGLPPDPWTRSPEIQHKKIYVTLKQKGHPWKVCLGSWMNKWRFPQSALKQLQSHLTNVDPLTRSSPLVR